MRNRTGVEGFSPWDLNNLQDCFDAILDASRLDKSSEEADEVAQALILAYKNGVRDRDELIRIAAPVKWKDG
ncbi:hypothetical protein [Mesorhizobium sp. CN2-181]|uniref:hypothetical protein n=1 Tax=Mesorhizobium yinganensis TaxID=3157707 RepID=UPI0032B7132E